jgi:N-acetyl-1-D-myo-inositol-2-amino-2-deoxy-alpha-D-glucopyranoside deacetylase
MAWHDDGYALAGDDRPATAFWDADLTEAATLLVEVVREVRPQVMTTYDQFGNYGHPDHIQAHRVATYAAFLAAVPTYRPDLGEPWEIAKIYWQAMAESRWRRSLRAIRAAGDTTSFEGLDPDGPLPMATPDADLAAEIDATEYADQKVAALHAHRTQIEVDGPFFALSNHVGNEVLGIESFRIAKGVTSPGPDGVETDLFAGI